MKTKIPLLIAVAMLLVSVSKAQYGNPCYNNRVVVHAAFAPPPPGYMAFNYNSHGYREPYDHGYGYNDRRVYDNRRDWREIEYERYCQDRRNRWISREDFYRDHCGYQPAPYCAPKRVVVYGY